MQVVENSGIAYLWNRLHIRLFSPRGTGLFDSLWNRFHKPQFGAWNRFHERRRYTIHRANIGPHRAAQIMATANNLIAIGHLRR
jgi:hypothetical protein